MKKPGATKRGAFTAALGDNDLDASVLLLPELGLIEPNDPRYVRTVEVIGQELARGHHMMRYTSADDFGLPESAFLICRFWLIDAWWWLGRRDEARDLFIDALSCRNRYGLLSEDIHPETGRPVGKFPANLFAGGIDPDGHALVSKLGGSVLARLILVSNRVPVPSAKGNGRAGGLEVALRSVFKHHPGVWFGWSGSVVPNAEAATETIERADSVLCADGSLRRRLPGVLQRIC